MSVISNSNMAIDLYNRLSYAGTTNAKKKATLSNLDVIASRINTYFRQGSPQELSTEEKIHTIFEEACVNSPCQIEEELITFYTKNIDVIQKFGVRACEDWNQSRRDLQELKVYGQDQRIFALTRFFAQEGVNIVRNLPEDLSKNLLVIKSLIDLKEKANALDTKLQLASTKEEKKYLENQLSLTSKDYDTRLRGLPIGIRGAIELEDEKVQNSMNGEFAHQDSQLQALRNMLMESQLWDLGNMEMDVVVKQEKKEGSNSLNVEDFAQLLDDIDQLLDESFASFESNSSESETSSNGTRATAMTQKEQQPVEILFPNSNLDLPDIDLTSSEAQAIEAVEQLAPQNLSSGSPKASSLAYRSFPSLSEQAKPRPAADLDNLVDDSPWVKAQPKVPQESRLSSVHRVHKV